MLLATAVIPIAVILGNLRTNMRNAGLHAYIIPYGGQHFDERLAPCDARIGAVSGFDGSAASVIVTLDQALLWTDGRYFLQADQQLDKEFWTLMKDGEIGTPTQSEWLNQNASLTQIGVDPKSYPKSSWDKMKSELSSEKTLVPTATNLVNEAWGAERPACPSEPIHALPLEFSGKNVADKLKDVRAELVKEGASALVVSELDEVAWLLNLRGTDFPSASIFFGFVIVGSTPSLFEIFVNQSNVPDASQTELRNLGAVFKPYTEIGTRLKEITELPATTKVWVSKYANTELANSVENSGKQLIKLTPIILMKSLKNPVEVAGMRTAHLKDSAAIVAFLSWLEIELNQNRVVNEITAGDKLLEMRGKGEYFVGKSFTTISGFGSNGAVIHYRPTPETVKNLTKNEVFLLDSGGLYWDGTTDITRTLHFGTPTAEQKDRFTRVLKGHIAIAKAIFPPQTTGHRLDSFARKALWDVGLDYKHGTGHGIGHYLNVHEGPQKVSFFAYVDDSGLRENMFVSNEPGYYKDGEYGIRIENIVRIASAGEGRNGFLGIETVSFVPIQKNMIDISILTEDEIKWVDDYHTQCKEKVLAHMNANPDNEYFSAAAKEYLTKETTPLKASTPNSALSITITSQFVFLAAFILRFI